VLNVGPDLSGRSPDDQVAVLMQVKKLIDLSVATTRRSNILILA
jgi:hypothetical protein